MHARNDGALKVSIEADSGCEAKPGPGTPNFEPPMLSA